MDGQRVGHYRRIAGTRTRAVFRIGMIGIRTLPAGIAVARIFIILAQIYKSNGRPLFHVDRSDFSAWEKNGDSKEKNNNQ